MHWSCYYLLSCLPSWYFIVHKHNREIFSQMIQVFLHEFLPYKSGWVHLALINFILFLLKYSVDYFMSLGKVPGNSYGLVTLKSFQKDRIFFITYFYFFFFKIVNENIEWFFFKSYHEERHFVHFLASTMNRWMTMLKTVMKISSSWIFPILECSGKCE